MLIRASSISPDASTEAKSGYWAKRLMFYEWILYTLWTSNNMSISTLVQLSERDKILDASKVSKWFILLVVTISFSSKYCVTLSKKLKTIYKCITEHDLRMKNGFCRETWRRGKKCERNTNKRVGDTKWGCLVQLFCAIWCVQLNQIVYRAQVSPTFKRIPKLCNMYFEK